MLDLRVAHWPAQPEGMQYVLSHSLPGAGLVGPGAVLDRHVRAVCSKGRLWAHVCSGAGAGRRSRGTVHSSDRRLACQWNKCVALECAASFSCPFCVIEPRCGHPSCSSSQASDVVSAALRCAVLCVPIPVAAITLQDGLAQVRTFIDANPTEVVVLLVKGDTVVSSDARRWGGLFECGCTCGLWVAMYGSR